MKGKVPSIRMENFKIIQDCGMTGKRAEFSEDFVNLGSGDGRSEKMAVRRKSLHRSESGDRE